MTECKIYQHKLHVIVQVYILLLFIDN